MNVPIDYSRSPLSDQMITRENAKLREPWEILEQQKLRRVFTFDTFEKAMAFVQEVAHLAETINHHPDIHIYFNKVVLELWTHDVSGLTKKDFSLAHRIEELVDKV